MAFAFQTLKIWVDQHKMRTALMALAVLTFSTAPWWQREAPVYFEAVDEEQVIGAIIERGFAVGSTGNLVNVDLVTTNIYAYKLFSRFRFNRFITTNAAEHNTPVTNAIGFYPRLPENAIAGYSPAGLAVRVQAPKWVRSERRDCYEGFPPDVVVHGSNIIDTAWWAREIGTNLTQQYGFAPQAEGSYAVLPYLLDTNLPVVYITTNALSQHAAVLAMLQAAEVPATYTDGTIANRPNWGWVYVASNKVAITGWDFDDDDVVDEDESGAFYLAARGAAEAAIAGLAGQSLGVMDLWDYAPHHLFMPLVALSSATLGGAIRVMPFYTDVEGDLEFYMIAMEMHRPSSLGALYYSSAVAADVSFYYEATGLTDGPYGHPGGLATNKLHVLGAPVDAATHLFWNDYSGWLVSNSVATTRYSAGDAIAQLDAVDDYYLGYWFVGIPLLEWQSDWETAVLDYDFDYLTDYAPFWENYP